jgi:hypothetical protein
MEFRGAHNGPMPELNARNSSAGHTPGLDLRMLSPLAKLVSPSSLLPESSRIGPSRRTPTKRPRRASAPSTLTTADIGIMLARALEVQGKRRRIYN